MRPTEDPDTAESVHAIALFGDAQAAVRNLLTGPHLDAAAAAAFGPDVTGAAVADAVDSFVRKGWPKFELLDEEALRGARAAYSHDNDTIYLSREFLTGASDSAVLAVFVEEIGHAIDARLTAAPGSSTIDARGDEGEIFSRFVLGTPPTADELAALQAQNDHGAIVIDGQTIDVEFASTSTNGAKVAIVFSQTSANRYFGQMAYSQLFMTAQSQATMAGVPFDVIAESDLTNVSLLTQYDALVFPSFMNVQSANVAAITSALTQAEQAGVGIIAAGEFMTYNQNGGALSSPYSRMSSLLGLQPVGLYDTGKITVKAVNSDPMMADYSAGEVIHTYPSDFYAAYGGVSGVTPTVLAQQTVGSSQTQTYSAVQSTTRNGATVVHFSTEAMLGDNNLLWQAIDKVVNSSPASNQVTAGLQMSRGTSIVASRTDVDQAMYPGDVSPGDRPGILDKLTPILQNWKNTYNFVGSYYVDIGNAPPRETTNWAISGQYYKQWLDMGNELGSHSLSHPHNTDALTAAQIQSEFQGSKQIIEQQMSQILGRAFVVEGAAVPGNPESLSTALSILQYYDYLSGGASTLGAGYPGAIGYLTPAMAAADKVYIAPNVSFDFSLIEFQGMTPAQASAKWLAEWNALTAHADVPIVVWPWHDYGAAEWSYDGTTPSLYTTQMFTDFIARAYNAGAEFVTLADLANRVSSFDDSALTWTRNTSTQVTATVTSAAAGKFALDLDNLGSQKIATVANWYAYDDDSVFLPRDGGTFTINLGASATDVTHITSLPMRAELLSLSGNGTNLSFSVIGEGRVLIDLVAPAGRQVNVTGATVVSLVGDKLTIDLGTAAQDDVSITLTSGGNSPPTITSNGGGASAALSVPENTTAVTTVTATDPNAGQTITYSINGGADASRFAINAQTGVLSFVSAPDFESPADQGANNVYDVTVRAQDSAAGQDTQALAVTVTNVAGQTLTGTSGADTLTGGGEEDTISGLGGNDTLSGLGGNDTIFGGAGADTMSGGPGNDVYYADNWLDHAIERVGEGNDTVVTTIDFQIEGNVENLTYSGTGAFLGVGNELGNTITGGAGSDTLYGWGGDDTLVGGAGADTMYGGSGNDVYYADNWLDHAIERVGEGNDTVVTTIDFQIEGNVENLTYSGTGAFLGVGNELGNTITGGAGSDTLYGWGGDDTLVGGAGADTMYGGSGNDVYYADNWLDHAIERVGEGNDTVVTTIDFQIEGNVENLTYSGTGAFLGVGNELGNTITGGAGSDTLYGWGGDDTLVGGAGADTMYGGSGNDVYYADNWLDHAIERVGEGNDTVVTTIDFQIEGNVENLTYSGTGAFLGVGNELGNTITGGAAGDDLYGWGGNDTLNGGLGNDILRGGGGADTLAGGAGSDRFVFSGVNDGLDAVVDFQRGAGNDILDIRSVLTGYSPGGSNAANFVRLTASGANTILSVNSDGAGTDFVNLALLQNNTGLLLNDLIANGNLLLA